MASSLIERLAYPMPHILQEVSNITGAHSFHVRNLPLLKGQRVSVSRLKT